MTNNLWIELSDDSAQNIGGGFNSDYATVYFDERFYANKQFYSYADPKGHLATAESDAYASGPGSAAQIFTYTDTTPYYSVARGTSISASK
jgi:hypothetical protein